MPNKVTNQGSMAWMDVGMLRPGYDPQCFTKGVSVDVLYL